MQKTSQQDSNQMTQVPQPIRGNEGGTDAGPRNVPLDRQNPDILTPPRTDAGTIPNMKFSFGLAHNRLLAGGSARPVAAREVPIATTLAGDGMRLHPGLVRPLPRHQGPGVADLLEGRARTSPTHPQ